MEHAIEAEGLVKTYPKGVTALDGLSFAVEPGSVFALLGPNGAGKSTAVKILTTLARPTGATRSSHGLMSSANPDRVRRRIGVVAQGTGVDIQATGRENLRLQGQLYGMRGRAARAAGRGAARALRSSRRCRPDRAGLLGRDAAPPGHRDGARPRPRGAVPRRADHRARPGGPRRDVGRDRAARAGPRQDRAADDPLPRGGRPARRRGSRSSTAARWSRRAPRRSSSASCAATRSYVDLERRVNGAVSDALAPIAGGARGRRRRPRAAGPRRRRRARRAVGAPGARGPRHRGVVGPRRAALARRRLPRYTGRTFDAAEAEETEVKS